MEKALFILELKDIDSGEQFYVMHNGVLRCFIKTNMYYTPLGHHLSYDLIEEWYCCDVETGQMERFRLDKEVYLRWGGLPMTERSKNE